MKICNKCNKEKELVEFHNHPGWRDGHYNVCKVCRNEWKRSYDVEYRARHRQEILLKQRLWRYGLTMDQFISMTKDQRNRCAICQIEIDLLYVDHNHDSGVVRGLLCSACNKGLGFFKDDPELLKAAIDYLQSKITSYR